MQPSRAGCWLKNTSQRHVETAFRLCFYAKSFRLHSRLRRGHPGSATSGRADQSMPAIHDVASRLVQLSHLSVRRAEWFWARIPCRFFLGSVHYSGFARGDRELGVRSADGLIRELDRMSSRGHGCPRSEGNSGRDARFSAVAHLWFAAILPPRFPPRGARAKPATAGRRGSRPHRHSIGPQSAWSRCRPRSAVPVAYGHPRA